MAGFNFERNQLAYLVARGALREILGRYLGLPAQAVRFEYMEYGRPVLAGDQGGLDFNLSHTEGLAVAAVARDLRVGIDIEARRAVELEVAAVLFSPQEQAALGALTGERQRDGFYRCWTRKEAIGKAEGLGLNLDMAAFSVSLVPEKPPQIVSGEEILSVAWELFEVEIEEGITGALAVSARPREIRRFQYRP